MKLIKYRHTCTVQEETPYRVADGVPQGVQVSQGVLHVGRVLWLKNKPGEISPKSLVSAYAKGIGLITIGAQLIK